MEANRRAACNRQNFYTGGAQREGAGGFGLLIALYDTLAGNLRRAAEAERCNNLEKRCMEVNHAVLVIAYLEDCIERASGGELASSWSASTRAMRRKLIEAQAKRSPKILEEQMERVLQLRESWQTMELSVPDVTNTFPGLMASDDRR